MIHNRTSGPRRHSRLRTAIATGTAAGVLLSVAAAPSMASDTSPVPVPSGAVDVSTADTNLASTNREVVVTRTTEDGVELSKLRVPAGTSASSVAAALDAQPGVSAEVNQALSLPVDATSATTDRSNRIAAPLSASIVPRGSTEPRWTDQWGMSWIGTEKAWATETGDATVTVAVLDTGVDHTHIDLAGRVSPQVEIVGDGLSGDPNGHGTHVAGVVAATLNGTGIAGVAPTITVLPVRVLDDNGNGDAFSVATGIYEAMAHGARVITMSLGGGYSQTMADAVAAAVAQDITVVAAVGNSYQQGNPTTYPAALPGVLGVSSINSAGQSSWFANTGSYVDLSAPGESILSTYPGNQWIYLDGTSMATPHVAAAAGLLLSAKPSLSAAEVSSILTTTAQDDGSGNGRDNTFGYGLLRVDNAVAYALPVPTATHSLTKANISPEPVRYGRYANVYSTAKTKYTDGVYRKSHVGTTYQVQFRKRYSSTWTTVTTSTLTTEGSIKMRVKPSRDGYWRVVIGSKASRSDYLNVLGRR